MAKIFEVTYLKYSDEKKVKVFAASISSALEKGIKINKREWGTRVKGIVELFDNVEQA